MYGNFLNTKIVEMQNDHKLILSTPDNISSGWKIMRTGNKNKDVVFSQGHELNQQPAEAADSQNTWLIILHISIPYFSFS